MRKVGNVENRPEQHALLKHLTQTSYGKRIELEYKVFSNDGGLIAIIDVANVTDMIAYRLRSAFSYHDSSGQTLKDNLQRERLEYRGWRVIDVTQDSEEYSWLWD
jgi:hypothetical protein